MSRPVTAYCDMIIRTYKPADWADVCLVHDEARVQELAAGGIDAGAFRSMADVAELEEFFASETSLACIDHSVVGFISWNGAYITWLYVKPAYQRRGVGGRLLRDALGRIGPQAWTNMIAGNEAALALYRGFGMEFVRRQSGQCEGFPCELVRLALPTSRMRDPTARRKRSMA